MKVALFVEGSVAAGKITLAETWKLIPTRLGLVPPDRVIAMTGGKKLLTAMDPSKPRMSGASEGFDELLIREHKNEAFDAAVVLWDLMPAWTDDEKACQSGK